MSPMRRHLNSHRHSQHHNSHRQRQRGRHHYHRCHLHHIIGISIVHILLLLLTTVGIVGIVSGSQLAIEPTAATATTNQAARSISAASSSIAPPPPPSSLPSPPSYPSSQSQLSSSAAASTSPIATEPATPCEPTVLPEVPPAPYYDASETTETAARQLAEYLGTKAAANADQLRRHANGIASAALHADEGLLAVALAAPGHKLAVVKFRDHVEAASNASSPSSSYQSTSAGSHSYLGTYWRELGEAWNRSDGAQLWGAPFRDCGPMRGRWLWPFSVTVQVGAFKTVASAFIAADDDQCNDALEPIFGKRHSCDLATTFCLQSIPNGSLTARGAYTCLCKFGYHRPGHTLQGFDGHTLEASDTDNNSSSSSSSSGTANNGTCVPCPGGCDACDQHGECFDAGDTTDTVTLEWLLSISVSTVLGLAVLLCVGLSVVVYRQRRCRTISSGMWTILETILLGIVLMYAAVALHLLRASTLRCLLESWCRELGFIICYGAIILKLYRHLVEFRTRKAHRWVLRDTDLLKYLGTMTFAVVCYMAAFTASTVDLMVAVNKNLAADGDGDSIFGRIEMRAGAADPLGGVDGETFGVSNTNFCRQQRWEYVTQTAEICILAFGVHLAVASRNAITQFRERQFLVASIVIEFIVSSSYYLVRLFYLQQLSPGAIFVALFVRSQLTNTVTLALVFLPKLWYQQKQGSHESGGGVGGGGGGGGHHGAYAGICLGDPDMGEPTLSEMNPDEIRAEFKRLYTQLEVLKNKTMRQDNPHISKRRGGRKAAHRRFSLQALSGKHRNNRQNTTTCPVDMEVTEAEASRTPEDSVCSVDGTTDFHAEMSTTTVSNK